MLVRFLMTLFAISGAALAVDDIPEVCGLNIVPTMTEQEKEQSSDNMEGPEAGTDEDLPEGAVVIGDMILNKEQADALMNKGQDNTKKKRNVINDEKYRWEVDKPVHWSLHRTMDETTDARLVENIKKSLKIIQRYTCIKFEQVEHSEKDSEKFHIMYLKSATDSTQSYVGKQQKYNKEKGITNNYQIIKLKSSVAVNAILHETMHALGFNHEQERPDRDQYVNIIHENIKPGSEHNFIKSTEGSVETFNEPYDFNSIMHYGPKFFGKMTRIKKAITIEPTEEYKTVENKPRVIGPLESLTAGDCRKLNKLFKCSMPSKEQIDRAIGTASAFLHNLYEKHISKNVAANYLSSLYKKITERAEKEVKGGVCELYEQKNNDK